MVKNSFLFVRVFAVVAYVSMVFVNVLANSLPINGRSTGVISDSYPNLFAPAGITFSIWGVIYFLLAGFLVYQFFLSSRSRAQENFLFRINVLFILTSIVNLSWVFAWHYDFIGLSLFLMISLLVLLILIVDTIRGSAVSLSKNFFVSVPFMVYFGWITVALIANVTVFLVSISWDGFSISEVLWTSIVLCLGVLIGVLRMCKDESFVYGLVLVWAYSGILFKHVSVSGFNGLYPSIIFTLYVCLVVLVFFVLRVVYLSNWKK
jgi:hypothetical protein